MKSVWTSLSSQQKFYSYFFIRIAASQVGGLQIELDSSSEDALNLVAERRAVAFEGAEQLFRPSGGRDPHDNQNQHSTFPGCFLSFASPKITKESEKKPQQQCGTTL